MSTPTFHLSDLFELVAAHVPDHLALVAGDRRYTYAGLDAVADSVAAGLVERDVEAGEMVALHSRNSAEWVVGFLAILKVRGVPVPVNYRYTPIEIEYLYADAGVRVVLLESAAVPSVLQALPQLPLVRSLIVMDGEVADLPKAPATPNHVQVEPWSALATDPTDPVSGRSGDDVYALYTGGTTGFPKGVLWRHEDIFMAALGGERRAISQPTDVLTKGWADHQVIYACGPLMHGNAQWAMLNGFFGGSSVVLNVAATFEPERLLDIVAAERVTTLSITGDSMGLPLADALERPSAPVRDLSSVRRINSGGATLSAEVRAVFARKLPNARIVDGFGSSETGALGVSTSVGGEPRFVLGDHTVVVDEEWRPVSPEFGNSGRLARRGHVPLGYHNDAEKTAATFREIDGVRWTLTGDVVTFNEDGSVRFQGRGSSCINTGGEKVFPDEVEAVLRSHPAVDDAVVVGVAAPRWGEIVGAVVRTSELIDALEEELQEFCRDRLAAYKVPRRIVAREFIKRSDSGKLDYSWARTALAEATGNAG